MRKITSSSLVCFFMVGFGQFLCDEPYISLGSAEDSLGIVAPYLPENPNILEAGAYDGSSSEHLSKLWPKGSIFAFEPAPDMYQILFKRVRARRNVYPYPFALSDKKGVAPFHISIDTAYPDKTFQSSSLLAPKEHLTRASWVAFPRDVQVLTTTIDEWAQDYGIDHIDFMWLDMQGAELQVLKASPRILKTVRAIATEVEMVEAYEGQALCYEVKAWLESQGFTMIASTLNLKTPDLAHAWFGDALFVRKNLED